MLKLIALLSVFVATYTMAGCKDDLDKLQDKKTIKLVLKRDQIITEAKYLNQLSKSERKAADNYIQYLSYTFNEEMPLQVTRYEYRSIKSDTLKGYKIVVTDGGDESQVRYYMKANQDILYRAWDNQSSEYTFVCEGY